MAARIMRKSLKLASGVVCASEDVERLKILTRCLLAKLEEALDGAGLSDDILNTHERLFGAKASLASTLVMLADLLLKLGSVSDGTLVEQYFEPAANALSESDVALVEAFVRKMQQAEMV